jgi:hypothetical protein
MKSGTFIKFVAKLDKQTKKQKRKQKKKGTTGSDGTYSDLVSRLSSEESKHNLLSDLRGSERRSSTRTEKSRMSTTKAEGFEAPVSS